MLRSWYGLLCHFKFAALTIVALPIAQDAMGQSQMRVDLHEVQPVQVGTCSATQRCELAIPQMRPVARPSTLATRRGSSWAVTGGGGQGLQPIEATPLAPVITPPSPSTLRP